LVQLSSYGSFYAIVYIRVNIFVNCEIITYFPMVIIIQCDDQVGLVANIASVIETAALKKAMQLVFEDRVFVYNNKNVVFE